MRWGRRATSFALALTTWVGAPVHAQTSAATAEALFDAGRAAAAAGDHATACEKFRESHRLQAGAGTLLNIGDCAEKLGRLLESWQSYSEARKILDPDDRRMPYAEERYAALDARIARLTLRLADDAPSDTEVERDGVILTRASLGVALPLEPGEAELIVRAPGHEERRYAIQLAEGERRSLVVGVGPALPEPAPVAPPVLPEPAPPRPEPAPAAPTEDESPSLLGPILGGSAIGLGAVFAAVGVGYTIDLASRRSDLDELCGDDGSCPETAAADVDVYNDRRPIPPAMFITSGVVTAAGVLVLLLVDDDVPAEGARWRPTFGPGFAGVRGRW